MSDSTAPISSLGQITEVTILLTDVEGSTSLWEHSPREMERAIARHNDLADRVITEFNGEILKHKGEGDSLFAVFQSPKDAVLAAVQLQRAFSVEKWPEPISLRVRMAVHYGRAFRGDRDYFGPMVNRCARIRGVAAGGQILLSEIVAESARVVSAEGDQLHLLDLGVHRLRDLLSPERLFQVSHADLFREFPPIRGLSAIPNNIPLVVTPFFGRKDETRELRAAITKHRIVTIKALGGTGKTRLALHVAGELLDEYPGGVWVLDLTAIYAADSILAGLAHILGLPESSPENLNTAVQSKLNESKALLVFDNCEQHTVAVAKIIPQLVAATSVHVLATSRTPLGLGSSERVFELGPLSADDASDSAVALFIDRAQGVSPGFIADHAALASIRRLCNQVEGSPLAIELAASWIELGLLKIEQLLDKRLRVVTAKGGSLQRQSCIQSVLEWSFNNLTPLQQELFKCIAVFKGKFTSDAFEAIGSATGIDSWDVLQALPGLADACLVRVETGTVAIYSVQETVRQFATDKLNEQGSEHIMRAAHAEYFSNLVTDSGSLGTVEEFHSDFIAALHWSIATDSGDFSKRIALSMIPFWEQRGFFIEGCQALGELLTLHFPAEDRAFLLNAMGAMQRKLGDLAGASKSLHEAKGLIETSGDQHHSLEATVLANLASIATMQGDLEDAEALTRASMQRSRDVGDQKQQLRQQIILANIQERRDQFIPAEKTLRSAIEFAKSLNDPGGLLYCHANLALILDKLDRRDEAKEEYVRALELSRQTGERYTASLMLTFISQLLRKEGDVESAFRILKAARQLRVELGVQLSAEEAAEEESEMKNLQEILGTRAADLASAEDIAWPKMLDLAIQNLKSS